MTLPCLFVSGMAIYNVCVVAGIGVVCATALYNTDHYSSGFLLVTLTVFICTTGTLLLIFVPKVTTSLLIKNFKIVFYLFIHFILFSVSHEKMLTLVCWSSC